MNKLPVNTFFKWRHFSTHSRNRNAMRCLNCTKHLAKTLCSWKRIIIVWKLRLSNESKCAPLYSHLRQHSFGNEFHIRRRSLCDVESKLSHLSRQLSKRELELTDAIDEIAKLKNRIDEMERTAERTSGERDKAKRELEAMRELCSKLEIEKEKLNAEVNEYAEIRRELERENDKLRNELMQVSRRHSQNYERTASRIHKRIQ